MTSALGPLRPILNAILNLIEKIMTTLTPNKKQDTIPTAQKTPLKH
jgi:hypothetical protein